MKITLSRLRALKAQSDAILSQKALGFVVDTKVSKLGRLAQQRIDYEDSLDKLSAQKNEIIKRIHDENQGSTEEEFNKLVLSDKGFSDLTKQEDEIWAKEADGFEFIPIKLSLKEDISEKFKDEAIGIEYRGRNHRVNPYLALHLWIDEGFIEIEE